MNYELIPVFHSSHYLHFLILIAPIEYERGCLAKSALVVGGVVGDDDRSRLAWHHWLACIARGGASAMALYGVYNYGVGTLVGEREAVAHAAFVAYESEVVYGVVGHESGGALGSLESCGDIE